MLRLERTDQPARRAVASVRGNAPHTPPLVARTPATHPPSASLHQPQSPRPPCLSQRGTHTGSDRQRAHPPTIAFSSIVIVIVSVIINLPRAREAQAPAHKRNRGRAPKGHSTSLSRWHARGPDAPERKHREHHEQPIESSRPAHRHATHLSPASRRPRTERLPAATWRKQGGTMARASPTHAHLHSPGALRQGPEPGGEAGHRDKRGLAHRVAFAFCARMMALHVWRKEGHSCRFRARNALTAWGWGRGLEVGFLVLYDVSREGPSYQTDHSNSTLAGTGLLFTSIIHTSQGKWPATRDIYIEEVGREREREKMCLS